MDSSSKSFPIMPTLIPQLEYLRSHSPVPLRVEQFQKGHRNNQYADRFTIYVPCCLEYVKWEVLFNCRYPEMAPDIIFGPHDDYFQPLAVAEGAPNPESLWALLSDWKTSDPSRLLKLCLHLRALYLLHQQKQVEGVEDPRVKFEIGTISAMELFLGCRHGVTEGDDCVVGTIAVSLQGLEMRYNVGGDNAGEVQFAVPLDVDLSQITQTMPVVGKLWNHIALQATYSTQKGQSASPAPQLKLHAPSVVREVFDIDSVKLPIWQDRMCLMEYVPLVQDLLRVQFRDAVLSIDFRKSFIKALMPVFGRPLEFEAGLYRRVSLLAASGVFCFLVHFSISTQFPMQQPILRFQSSQHFDSRGKPIVSRPYSDYPWSPRWDGSRMAMRIFEFVADESNAFKRFCNEMLQA